MAKSKKKFIDRRLIKNRKYHFLYKTINLLSGKYYYGMHSTNNLDDGYLGSGVYLRRAILKYGKENFKLEMLKFFDTRKELAKAEEELITEEMIKDSKCYNVQGGGEVWNSNNTVVVKDKDGNCFRVHKDDPRYLSGKLISVAKGYVTVKDKHGKFYKVEINDPRYLSGELVHMSKGKVNVKDKNGNTFKVDINDPRYLSGKLIHVSKGMLSLKDEKNNYLQVDKNDLRYLSGELFGTFTGKKHTKETREKMSKSQQGKQKGSKNSQYGTCWITKDKVNKKIKKEDLDDWLFKGWKNGRSV